MVVESSAKQPANVAASAQLISFGQFTASVDPLAASMGPFVVGNSSCVLGSSSSDPVLYPDQSTDEQQSSGMLFPRPALKKGCTTIGNLNLGSFFLTNDNDYSINRGGSEVLSLNSARCSRCLRRGHRIHDCRYLVRCVSCFNYGRWAKQCFSKSKRAWSWRPKSPEPCISEASPKLCWKPKVPIRGSNSNQQPVSLEDAFTPRDTQTLGASASQSPPIRPPPIQRETLLAGDGTRHRAVISTDSTFPITLETMANFTCDPAPFLPFGAHVEDGWLRPMWARLALGGEPPRGHKEYTIVSMEPPPHPMHARLALTDVINFVQEHFPVRIMSSFLSPLGLGLLEFGSSVQRQSMTDISPFDFDDISVLRVVKHDEAGNLRACPYTRECWIMFLAFPLDYQREEFVDATVATFGRRLHWHQGPNKSRTLVRCLVLAPKRVPRSLVVSQGTTLGGMGRSWTVPTFILGGHLPDVMPTDEDPIPGDGNPHPAHGAPLAGNPNIF